jgi:hypothetical protein
MYIKITIWHKLILLFMGFFFSAQVLANCIDTCVFERNNCQQTSTQLQNTHCDEQFSVCTLSCNRQQTMSCVYLGFKNHDGTADKEKELNEITGGFARVTDEINPHFAGLCRSNNMRCEYVLEWDRTMLSCGGPKRDPRRVACCR